MRSIHLLTIRRRLAKGIELGRTRLLAGLRYACSGVLLASLSVGTASATAGGITSFPLPGLNNLPTAITTGPDGALWFTETGKIGRLATAGVLHEFALPSGHTGSSLTSGSASDLWFTEPGASAIGHITVSGAITEVSVPGACQAGYSCPVVPKPQAIAMGSNGTLWFTETMFSRVAGRTTGAKVVQMTASRNFTEFVLPGGTTKATTPTPGSIVSGPDGALWFTDPQEGKIWRITRGGALSQFKVPVGAPSAITAGPDGVLWFTANAYTGSRVDRLTMAGSFTEFPIPSGPNGTSLGSIAAGPDGNLWFAQYDMTQSAGILTRMTLAGNRTNFGFPTYTEIDGVTKGPDTALWFTSTDNSTGSARIGRIATS